MRIFLLVILCVTTQTASGASFDLPKEVYDAKPVKSECSTGTQDYCITHIGFKGKLWSGGTYGTLSIVLWSGSTQYAWESGECYLKAGSEIAYGTKERAPSMQGGLTFGDFTACVWRGDEAVKFIKMALKPQKVFFHEPARNGKNRDASWFTRDDASVDYLLAVLLQHLDVSSKRVAGIRSNAWIHKEIGSSEPLAYASMLAKYKWYSSIE
jgi:hypothetical protein